MTAEHEPSPVATSLFATGLSGVAIEVLALKGSATSGGGGGGVRVDGGKR